MTTRKLINCLRTNVPLWNRYVSRNKRIDDKWYANLRNADLSNADLRNVNLHNTNLHDANLLNANLLNANLDFASIQLSCKSKFKADRKICKQIAAHLLAIMELSNIDDTELLANLRRFKAGWHRENEF